ncbi:MAG: hypothetical protein FJW39_32730 [Acidobacteria bacterium]|nr:hypothetical protein [Acidobacteriota bacterium]
MATQARRALILVETEHAYRILRGKLQNLRETVDTGVIYETGLLECNGSVWQVAIANAKQEGLSVEDGIKRFSAAVVFLLVRGSFTSVNEVVIPTGVTRSLASAEVRASSVTILNRARHVVSVRTEKYRGVEFRGIFSNLTSPLPPIDSESLTIVHSDISSPDAVQLLI